MGRLIYLGGDGETKRNFLGIITGVYGDEGGCSEIKNAI